MFKVEVPVYKVTTKDYYVFIYCYITIKTFEKERSSKLLEDGVRYLPIIPTITNVVSCIVSHLYSLLNSKHNSSLKATT